LAFHHQAWWSHGIDFNACSLSLRMSGGKGKGDIVLIGRNNGDHVEYVN
jgi:hypothetical protein